MTADKDHEDTERSGGGSGPCHGRAVESRAYRHWTTREVAILRAHYAMGGAAACAAQLPQRSLAAIQNKAKQLGLRAPQSPPRQRRWASSEAMDAEIRRVYRTEPRKNAVNALAERIQRPRWWVSKRARQLGLIAPRFKEPAWSKEELALLEQHAHKADEVIARILRRAGFSRSASAIHVKRRRVKLTVVDGRRDAGLYSANEVAALLGVDAKTVTRWIGERTCLPGAAAPRAPPRRAATSGRSSSASCAPGFAITRSWSICARSIATGSSIWHLDRGGARLESARLDESMTRLSARPRRAGDDHGRDTHHSVSAYR